MPETPFWLRPDVRAEQCRNAIAELQRWRELDVYRVFVDVSRRLVARGYTTLVDVGAGAGQYGVLWLGECGGYEYMACVGEYPWRDGEACYLASAAIEYAPYPPGEVSAFNMSGQPFILHRLRFHDAPGAFVPELSYCGETVPMWRWNREELTAALAGCKIERHVWPSDPRQETWVCEPAS